MPVGSLCELAHSSHGDMADWLGIGYRGSSARCFPTPLDHVHRTMLDRGFNQKLEHFVLYEL